MKRIHRIELNPKAIEERGRSNKLEEPWRRWGELRTVQEIGRRRMNEFDQFQS
jgi:hypothetical protein